MSRVTKSLTTAAYGNVRLLQRVNTEPVWEGVQTAGGIVKAVACRAVRLFECRLRGLPLYLLNTTKLKTCLTDIDIRVLHCMDAYSHQTGTCLVSDRVQNTLLSAHFSSKLGDRSSYFQAPRRA